MSRVFKKIVCHAAKWTGCFRLARRLTGDGLRILAYHGFALSDEGSFLPGVFMDASEFRWRVEYLVRHGYHVLPLDEALRRLYQGTLPPNSVVLTFDDGFFSTWKLGGPILREQNVPGTVYVTTYYCLKQTPVFRLVVRYMLWKTKKRELDLAGLGLEEQGIVALADAPQRDRTAGNIFRYAEARLHEEQRVELCTELGRRLAVDYEKIVKERYLSLMTSQEVREAVESGLDIQLHTHRHVLPSESDRALRELEENRRILDTIVPVTPAHFSYPSGIRFEQHDVPLTAAGVLSATTCASGVNFASTPPLQLARFLDGNDISRIEFEAEMSGFFEVMRRLRGALGKLGFRFLSARREPPPVEV